MTIVYNLASPGLMAILFFTAGVSSMLSLKKRTIREFYQNRMQKIVIPGVMGVLFWVPIQSYFTMKNHFDYIGNFLSAWWYFYSHISSNFYGYDGSFSPSQLWFLLYLGTYVILSYPFIRRLLSKPGELSNKEIVSWKSILLLVILNCILSYGTTEETYLAFGLFFLLGLLLYDNQPFYEFTRKYWKTFSVSAFFINVIASITLVIIRDMEIWTVSYAICRMIWSTACVSVVLATMGAGQIWMDGNGKLLKWLSNNSFNFYFLHMQLLIIVAYYVVTYLAVSAGVQWIAILLASSVLTIIVNEVMKRVPVFQCLYGLRR